MCAYAELEAQVQAYASECQRLKQLLGEAMDNLEEKQKQIERLTAMRRPIKRIPEMSREG